MKQFAIHLVTLQTNEKIMMKMVYGMRYGLMKTHFKCDKTKKETDPAYSTLSH